MPIASTTSVWCDPGMGRRPVKDHPQFWTVKGLHLVGVVRQCITNPTCISQQARYSFEHVVPSSE